MNRDELVKKAVEFHGHLCPGIAMGIVVAGYVLEHESDFSIDEELVAIVENDNCSVDALQALLGTTFGKGNLVFKDYGKNNYTIYNREKGDAFHFRAKAKRFGERRLSREEKIESIIASKAEDLFTITRVEPDPPGYAEIYKSVICDSCGDPVMSTRIRKKDEKNLCIPCAGI
jgi:formylmethanofuran dehydrogenase subunit E